MKTKTTKKKDVKPSESDFKCGGKETTQKRLLERVKELQKKDGTVSSKS
jgi:hypothetical protein